MKDYKLKQRILRASHTLGKSQLKKKFLLLESSAFCPAEACRREAMDRLKVSQSTQSSRNTIAHVCLQD